MDTYGIFATSPARFFHGRYLGPSSTSWSVPILVVLIAALIDDRNQAPAGNLRHY